MCGDENGNLTAYRRLVAGALAGATAQIATYPMEMIRARITIDSSNTYHGIRHAFSLVFRNEGIFAFYKGIVPSLAGIIPYVGLDFAVYETLKELPIVKKDPITNQPTVVAKLICGATAGLVGQTIAYPLDVVRRRLQVQGGPDTKINERHYKGMVDCIRKTWKYDGFKGFYKGLMPNYLKVSGTTLPPSLSFLSSSSLSFLSSSSLSFLSSSSLAFSLNHLSLFSLYLFSLSLSLLSSLFSLSLYLSTALPLFQNFNLNLTLPSQSTSCRPFQQLRPHSSSLKLPRNVLWRLVIIY